MRRSSPAAVAAFVVPDAFTRGRVAGARCARLLSQGAQELQCIVVPNNTGDKNGRRSLVDAEVGFTQTLAAGGTVPRWSKY